MSLNRRKEREIVFQMLFASRFSEEENNEEFYNSFIEECEEENAGESKYIKDVFFGAKEYAPKAHELISSAAVGWKLERLSKVTLTILELALFEMNMYEEVPTKISINEAVELAKKFDDDKAPKFINGILGTLAGEEK